VSAPALPSPPAGTQELFGPAWAQARAYAELLVTQGVVAGVIGPREIDRVWDRHIRNSLAVSPYVARDARVVDLGSGAGLPGIPLALARPDLAVTLLEPMARRVRFLEMATGGLEGAVRIRRGRAEDGPGEFDTVVCRAVAPLVRLVPLAYGLLRHGIGTLVALKGKSAGEEIDVVTNAVSGGARGPGWAPSTMTVHDATWPDPATVIVVTWSGPSRRREPR